MNVDQIVTYVTTHGIDLVVKIAAALAMWFGGRWVIGIIGRLIEKALGRGGKIDPTLAKYLLSIIKAVMTVGLAIGIIGYLGVETTSFAALLAGAGLAIGTAWGGLLQHFAAGAFIQLLRPFKVGDYVNAGGVEGTVAALGLFGTTILSPDNVTTTIGNSKVFSEIIKNFSTQPYRRVDAVAKIANGVDPVTAIAALKPVIAAIPNVLATPAPDVEILELTAEGPKLCVRPYCHTDHYWQVYFDTLRAVVETFGKAGLPTPETPVAHRLVDQKA